MKRYGYLLGFGVIGCLSFCGCMPQAVQEKIISNAREDLQTSNRKIETQQQTMLSSLQQEASKKIQSMTADVVKRNREAVSAFTADSKKLQIEISKKIQSMTADAVKRNSEAVSAFTADSKKLQQETSKKIQSMTADVVKRNSEAISAFTADSKKLQQEAVTSLQNHNRVMQNWENESSQTIKQMAEDIKSENSKALDKAVQDFHLLVQTKVAGNEKAAEEAFAQARTFVDSENFIMARMYCLNAINHLPSNYPYYEKLVEIQQAIQDSKPEDWEQIRNIVELGLYQIDSKYISDLLKIQEGVMQKIHAMEKQAAEEEKNRTQQAVNQLLQEVQSINIKGENFVETSTDSLLDYIEKLNKLSNNADYLSEEERNWVQEQAKLSLEISNYTALLKKIKIYLDKADALLQQEKQEELPAVSSMVQSANQLITQGWSLDKNNSFLQYYQLLKDEAKRIAALEQKFNSVKSIPAMNKINALSIDNFISSDNTSHGEFTKKIEATQKYIGEVAKLSAEIYDRENQLKIQELLKQSNLQIQDYSKERYKKYQEWAVEQCRSAFAKYNSWTWPSKDDAKSVIDDFLLEIDSTLLTPTLAALYQDVLQKPLGKLSTEQKIEYQAKLAESTKKTLEDY